MNRNQTDSHIIPCSESVKTALDRLDALSGGSMLLFAVDREGRLCGSVTDGDIRRALLRGVRLDEDVSEAMNSRYTAITPGDDTTALVAEGKRRHLHLLPVTDGKGRIENIINIDAIEALLPLDGVLMAGGKGERLRPLTLDTPKPLLKVGGKPIIDRNIEALERFGINNIFVTVNYLHEQIEEHFRLRNEKAAEHQASVECVLEPSRLGTLGSVALVRGLSHDNLLVMNSDLLTAIDFEKMWMHHVESEAALTMAGVPYTVSVPFAIMRTEGTRVTGLEEKPTYNYFANGGVYMMRKELLDRIPKGEYLDAPDFIETLIADGLKVELFPIEGRWIDIGSPDDFKTANELLS